MPPVLRKRKAPEPAPAPAPKKAAAPKKSAPKKAADKVKKLANKVVGKDTAAKRDDSIEETKAAVEEEPVGAAPAETKTEDAPVEKVEPAAVAAPVAKTGEVAVGDVVDLETFGGEIETNDGEKTSLKKLVDESKAGVVLFTYPKASTPGCTNQACLFRDAYTPLTAGGLAIYGLSADSPKANTTFKEKQKLPYPLLCDKQATLIAAIGLKKKPSGTQRGVFIIDKDGKVRVKEAGGPAATVDRVKKFVDDGE